MDFSHTSEQDDLRKAVRAFATGSDPSWDRMSAQLGIDGLAAADSGASWVEIGVVLEELGAVLSPLPLLSHYVASSFVDAPHASISLGAGVAAMGGALLGRAEHVM